MRLGVAMVIGLSGASCGRIAFDIRSGDANDGNDVALAGDGPLDCPIIGDVCDDGTIYVGTSPDGNVAMYTEATSGPDGPWSTNPGPVTAVQTGLTSKVTGAANTAALALGGAFQDADAGTAGVQPNEAAERCSSLTSNGRTDWYLPALDELAVLSTNQLAIGGFLNDEYWASTEDTACPMDCAKAIDFPTGSEISFRNKFDFRRSRCVRK